MTKNQDVRVERFILIMKTFNLTQKDMAKKVGLSQPKVSAIINGKAGANILNDIFYRLNYEFDISKDWWETGKGEMVSNHNNEINQAEESEYWKNQYIEVQRKYTALLENKLKLFIDDAADS